MYIDPGPPLFLQDHIGCGAIQDFGPERLFAYQVSNVVAQGMECFCALKC